MIPLNKFDKLIILILGGVIGGQFLSHGFDALGWYDLYNPMWMILIGLVIMIAVTKIAR